MWAKGSGQFGSAAILGCCHAYAHRPHPHHRAQGERGHQLVAYDAGALPGGAAVQPDAPARPQGHPLQGEQGAGAGGSAGCAAWLSVQHAAALHRPRHPLDIPSSAAPLQNRTPDPRSPTSSSPSSRATGALPSWSTCRRRPRSSTRRSACWRWERPLYLRLHTPQLSRLPPSRRILPQNHRHLETKPQPLSPATRRSTPPSRRRSR
jgi:hypothetical protein